MSNPQLYVRAAALRAAILAHLNNHPEGATTLELAGNVQVDKEFFEPNFKVRRDAVHTQMITLRKHGSVTSVAEGTSLRYFLANKKDPMVAHRGAEPVHERRKADVQMEIVKSTGRVRVGVHGLVIEIGVVDK